MKEPQRLAQGYSLLHRHLIHTREIPNGRDFLFSGPENDLRKALDHFVENERIPDLQVTYVRVDDYYLLRLTGPEAIGETIRSFFK